LNTGNAITVQSDNNVILLNKGAGNGGGVVDTGTDNELFGNVF
jgi:hypothetical protein